MREPKRVSEEGVTLKTSTRFATAARAVAAALCALLLAPPALADPCGMVPPISWTPPVRVNVAVAPIERIGAQKTYVAFGNGIETMVLRPGFSGHVDEFGMLIPFPSPPDIRKVDESIFSHIAAAVDPPEVTVRIIRPAVRRYPFTSSQLGGGRGMSVGTKSAGSRFVPQQRLAEPALHFDTVKVVNQEAIGMYDVAVLEAGSTQALKRWMRENQFRYPDGMEAVTQEYVESRWVFVAIKTRVGNKAGVNPHPGMQSVNSQLPADATFNGFVQAMGFRFRVAEPVVPMRLSAFNAGKPRNVVYILAAKGMRLEKIPQRFVVRQVDGRVLAAHLTQPLPLRVIGGTAAQIPQRQKAAVRRKRRPGPYNGFAKELFTSDVAAIRAGTTRLEVESQLAELEAISNELLLTPSLAASLHDGMVGAAHAQVERDGLAALREMTLTIVDGEFERDVLAKYNLAFAPFQMPVAVNTATRYNARLLGPNKSGR